MRPKSKLAMISLNQGLGRYFPNNSFLIVLTLSLVAAKPCQRECLCDGSPSLKSIPLWRGLNKECSHHVFTVPFVYCGHRR